MAMALRSCLYHLQQQRWNISSVSVASVSRASARLCCSSPPYIRFDSFSSLSWSATSTRSSLCTTSATIRRPSFIRHDYDQNIRNQQRYSPSVIRSFTTTTTFSAATSASKNSSSTSSSSCSPVLLHYDWVTPVPPPPPSADASSSASSAHLVVVLHGLLGNGRNVRTLAKTYCQALQEEFYNTKPTLTTPTTTTTTTTASSTNTAPPHHMSTCKHVYGLTMDLRGHGSSASGALPPTMQACAQDVHATLEALLLALSSSSPASPTVFSSMTLVGHSWGGRVALQYTYDYYYNHDHNQPRQPSTSLSSLSSSVPKLRETWMLDSAPGGINQSVEQVLAVVQELEQARGEQLDQLVAIKTTSQWTKYFMEHYSFSSSLAQWLASSIDSKKAKPTLSSTTTTTPSDGATTTTTNSIQFVFDSRVALGLLPEFAKQNVLEMLQSMNHNNNSNNGKVTSNNVVGGVDNNDGPHIHLVRAGKNAGWTTDILQRLQQIQSMKNTNVHLHVLPNTGHWLHVEDLKGLVQLMIEK